MNGSTTPIPPHLRKKLAQQKANEEQQQQQTTTVPDNANNTSDAASTFTADSAHGETIRSVTPSSASRTMAVVPYGIKESYSPMELIQHETIQTLQALLNDTQAQLQAANLRCDALEAENAELQTQINSFNNRSEQASEAGGRTKATLCSYASSSEEEASLNGPTSPAQDSANERIDIMAQILEKQAEQQAKLEQTITTQAEQLKALKSTIEQDKPAQLPTPEKTDSPSPLSIHMLSDDLKALQQGHWNHEQALRKLVPFRKEVQRKIKQERRVDENAAIRENLLVDYEALTILIEDPEKRGDKEWQGCEDDLWALRDRVVRRLATFEACGKAQEEAKKQVEYNGKGSANGKSPPNGQGYRKGANVGESKEKDSESRSSPTRCS